MECTEDVGHVCFWKAVNQFLGILSSLFNLAYIVYTTHSYILIAGSQSCRNTSKRTQPIQKN